jgi:hypothetical protein
MPTLRELSTWIRDYGQDPRHQFRLLANEFVWSQLWTALDIIDDVESALVAYTENEFPTEVGEKYLRIYGIMLALFLQQDALDDLIKAIHPSKKISVKDILKDIREARKASIGHPTRMGRKGMLWTHGIVQHSLRKEGFELISYPKWDGETFTHVPVQELIEKQRAEAARILAEVVEELREQDKAHRAQFRETKIVQLFNQVSYAFEKIFEELHRGSGPILSNWAVDHLYKTLDDFEKLLKERGIALDSYDSIKYLYQKIEHPLTELRKFIKGERSEVLSDGSAAVFAEALQHYFSELRGIAIEIDEEYSSEPDPVVKPEYTGPPMTLTITDIGEALK